MFLLMSIELMEVVFNKVAIPDPVGSVVFFRIRPTVVFFRIRPTVVFFRIQPTVVFYIIHSFFYLIETKYFAQSEKRLL